ETVHDCSRPILIDNSRPECLARVGADDIREARLFLQSDLVKVLVWVPKLTIEALLQITGFLTQSSRGLVVAATGVEIGHQQLGSINISLYFHQRDWRRGERSIGIHDRVTRVLPSLIAQAFARLTCVRQVPKLRGRAVLVDPLQRTLHV